MIVAFDNTFLSIAFHPPTRPRPDPKTGEPVSHCSARIEALIDSLSRSNSTVIIPTPCFSELLCVVPDFERAISKINQLAAFDLAPFDERCAIDLAEVVRNAKAAGDKKSGLDASWNEIKFDRQIAMIAKVHGAEIFYTDDSNQAAFAKEIGLEVKHTWDLTLPSTHLQQELNL